MTEENKTPDNVLFLEKTLKVVKRIEELCNIEILRLDNKEKTNEGLPSFIIQASPRDEYLEGNGGEKPAFVVYASMQEGELKGTVCCHPSKGRRDYGSVVPFSSSDGIMPAVADAMVGKKAVGQEQSGGRGGR